MNSLMSVLMDQNTDPTTKNELLNYVARTKAEQLNREMNHGGYAGSSNPGPWTNMVNAIAERTRPEFYANQFNSLVRTMRTLPEELSSFPSIKDIRIDGSEFKDLSFWERVQKLNNYEKDNPNSNVMAALNAFGPQNLGGFAGIVSPKTAMGLNVNKSLPSGDIFDDAVRNTKGAAITDDGLLMRVARSQKPEQGNMESVRGGVFYLPEGAQQMKYYSTGRNGYGGNEKISGETLLRNPIFSKGGTGGKAPESAYDSLLGKGAYQKMRSEALDVNWGRRSGGGIDIEDFLSKYAPDMSGMGQYILENSKNGNQLAYALQEAAVSSAVRKAGHDAVLGFSKGKSGHFISELFDVRESHYPDKFGTYHIFDKFTEKP